MTLFCKRPGDPDRTEDEVTAFSGDLRLPGFIDLASVLSLVSGEVAGVALSISALDKGGLAFHVVGFFLPMGALAAAAANILGSSASALLDLVFFGDGVFGFHDRLAEKSFNRPLEYFLSVMAADSLDCFPSRFFKHEQCSTQCKVVFRSLVGKMGCDGQDEHQLMINSLLRWMTTYASSWPQSESDEKNSYNRSKTGRSCLSKSCAKRYAKIIMPPYS